LRELHEDIIKNPKNIIDDVLQVNHSSNLEVNKPHRYETIKANKLTVNNQPQFINHQESILIAAPNLYKSELAGTVSDFFSAAVKEFSPVGTLYFTTNQKVIEYVRSQGLIKIISLEQFREYKPPQKSPAKQRIEINLSEQRPAYQEPQRRIHIRKWTMDTPIRDLSQIVEEHNYVVDQYLELESENKNKELLSKENTSPYVGPFRDARDSRLIGEKVKLLKDNRKIVLWGAGLLIAALIIWVLYETFKTTETTQPLHSATPPPTRNPGSQNNPKTLSPTPTDELGGDDLKQLNIELKYLNSLTLRRISMSAVEATEVAIKLNPSDIGKAYGDQKEAFARRLIELNRGCFFEDNQIYRLNGLELQHVPTCRGCK
jgi:hypothetical protein